MSVTERHEAVRGSGRAPDRPGEQLKTRARLRKLRDVASAALVAVAELEATVGMDVWGRYELPPSPDEIDVEDLARWLTLAREEYEGMTVQLLAVVPLEDQ